MEKKIFGIVSFLSVEVIALGTFPLCFQYLVLPLLTNMKYILILSTSPGYLDGVILDIGTCEKQPCKQLTTEIWESPDV